MQVEAQERRHAAARAVLAEIKNLQGLSIRIDDASLAILSEEIGEHMLQEVVRICRATRIGFPTVLDLVTLAETIYLQTAVAALDQQESVANPRASMA